MCEIDKREVARPIREQTPPNALLPNFGRNFDTHRVKATVQGLHISKLPFPKLSNEPKNVRIGPAPVILVLAHPRNVGGSYKNLVLRAIRLVSVEHACKGAMRAHKQNVVRR